ncbi:MAG: NADP-dependent isocitrate dehydrogenase [Paenacidovorax caeni]
MREGNSDRRAPKAVKEYAPQEPPQHGRGGARPRARTCRTCTLATSYRHESP